MTLAKNVELNSNDIEIYLDDYDKSELSRIIWKVEQLKAAENDPDQLKLKFDGNALTIAESEEVG